jgi:sulfide:quinone oxidoreductase
MHVVVVGGGVAGLEAVLGLSALAADRVEIDLVAPTDRFVYRPMLVAEPFGSAEVLTIELDRVAQGADARHIKDALVAVDPSRRTIATASGAEVGYDALLIAIGARPTDAVPGAITFGAEGSRERFADALAALGRRSERSIAFVVPRAATWSLAAYELAFLTAAERDARRLEGVEILLVTHEEAPLDLFGGSAARLVAERLAEAGVALHTSRLVERYEDGELRIKDGGSLRAGAAVALPALEVPSLEGLPQQRHGFLQTDVAMHVEGLEAVWAAGDATWFPIKQGGLAAQQADVAARAIAARAGAHVPAERFHPVLRGALITGGAPAFMRASRGGQASDAATFGRELWWPPTKIAGRYLGPYIAGLLGGEGEGELADIEPSEQAEMPAEHDRSVALILAAADGEAAIGDFEGAMKWLKLAEQLNLVIPPEYVARRDEWRRQLRPDLEPGEAAARIDPSFADAATALSDLQRRLGWLREIEHRTEGEMRDHLASFDEDMDRLMELSRETGVLPRPVPRRAE